MSAPADSDVAVVRQPRDIGTDELDAELLRAFRACRDALVGGRPVLVLLHEEDVLAHGDPAGAAMAHALIGVVRALAVEGEREGWSIDAIGVGPGDDPDDGAWLARAGSAAGGNGALLRSGFAHLGRVRA